MVGIILEDFHLSIETPLLFGKGKCQFCACPGEEGPLELLLSLLLDCLSSMPRSLPLNS